VRKVFLIAALCAAPCGCASKSKPADQPVTAPVLRVTHQAGGAHFCTIVHQGVWYQAFGSKLLIVDPQEATVTDEMVFGKPGEIGPAVDMAVDEASERLYIVIEDDEVIELSVDSPQHPIFLGRLTAEQLKIRPRRLSTVDGQCYVSGPGGAVRLRDHKKVYSNTSDVGRIAPSAHGLVVSLGRQVRTIVDDAYIGSATDLQQIPGSADRAGNPLLIFVLQGADAGIVGLMSPDVRELPASESKTALQGQIRRVRLINNDIWIISDDVIVAYTIKEGQLHQKMLIDVLGARDVDLLRENYLAISGTAGRAIFRMTTDSKGAGDTFIRSTREPGNLVQAATDGQRILGGSREGLWQYLINSRVELTKREFDQPPPPPARRASTIAAVATISSDGKSLNITSAPGREVEPVTYTEPDGATIWCVAAVDGDFWISHDRGITALRPVEPSPDDQKSLPKGTHRDLVLGSVRIPGPVIYIYPLLIGGGVSYVSQHGGFGVAELKNEPVATTPKK
jgi:hypothetical protein